MTPELRQLLLANQAAMDEAVSRYRTSAGADGLGPVWRERAPGWVLLLDEQSRAIAAALDAAA